jgi:hypothetical protein
VFAYKHARERVYSLERKRVSPLAMLTVRNHLLPYLSCVCLCIDAQRQLEHEQQVRAEKLDEMIKDIDSPAQNAKLTQENAALHEKVQRFQHRLEEADESTQTLTKDFAKKLESLLLTVDQDYDKKLRLEEEVASLQVGWDVTLWRGYRWIRLHTLTSLSLSLSLLSCGSVRVRMPSPAVWFAWCIRSLCSCRLA